MPKRYDKIIATLQKRPLSENEILTLLLPVAGLFGDTQSEFEIFKNSGIPIELAHTIPNLDGVEDLGATIAS